MELTAKRPALIGALQMAASVADRRSLTQIMANTLLSVDAGGRLVCAATDGSVSCVSTVKCEAANAGGISVPAKELLDVIRGLPSDDVHMVEYEKWLQIKSGRSKFRIPGRSAEDFPSQDNFRRPPGSGGHRRHLVCRWR
jgi:DNA polymerase III subunit beta